MQQVKKYTGSSMSEILDRVKAELGRDALILKSTTRPGLFGRKSEFEVIAGAEPGPSAPSKPAQNVSAENAKLYMQIMMNELKGTMKESRPFSGESADLDLKHQFQELKILLESQVSVSKDPLVVQKIRGHLLNNGAERVETEKLLLEFSDALRGNTGRVHFEQGIQIVRALIERRFRSKSPKPKKQIRRIRALVGPTGHGKTTTLAKLASLCVVGEKKPAVLVSLDDYRLGAHAQLKGYADILSIPFYAVHTPTELATLVSMIPQNVNVFVDTSGVSPNNEAGLLKLASFLAQVPDAEACLVHCGATSFFEMKNTMRQFEKTGFKKMILTKIDEMHAFGHLLSLGSSEKVLEIEYLTDGQEVPKDIRVFSAPFLAEKIAQVV